MSAKINIGNIEITIPTNELGEALHQLAAWLPSQGQRPAAEPPAQRAAASVVTENADPRPARAATRPVETERVTGARLLKLIADHHVSGGVTADEIMPVLGTDRPKGIGSKVTGINRAIQSAGFADIGEVYTNSERATPKGPRIWRAGPRIKEAITALESNS